MMALPWLVILAALVVALWWRRVRVVANGMDIRNGLNLGLQNRQGEDGPGGDRGRGGDVVRLWLDESLGGRVPEEFWLAMFASSVTMPDEVVVSASSLAPKPDHVDRAIDSWLRRFIALLSSRQKTANI